jgi:transposase
MDKDRNSDIGLKVVKTPILGNRVCPTCGMKQPFVKDHEHWKKVKDLSLDKPTLLSVQRISAKCLNPACKRKSFVLPCLLQADVFVFYLNFGVH